MGQPQQTVTHACYYSSINFISKPKCGSWLEMVNSGGRTPAGHSSASMRLTVTFNVDILHIHLLVSKNLIKFRENNICFKPGRKIWAARTQFNSDVALIFFHMYTNSPKCGHFKLNVLFHAERNDKVIYTVFLLFSTVGWLTFNPFFSPEATGRKHRQNADFRRFWAELGH